MITFSDGIHAKAAENAKMIGSNTGAVLAQNGFNRTSVTTNAKRNYVNWATGNSFDTALPYSRLSEDMYSKYCRAFMLNPQEFIVDESTLVRLLPVTEMVVEHAEEEHKEPPQEPPGYAERVVNALEKIADKLEAIDGKLDTILTEEKEGILCIINEMDKTEQILTETFKTVKYINSRTETLTGKACDIASEVSHVRQSMRKR